MPGASPLSGTPPPAAHQFQPGQSGNPKGRPSAGATLREWVNQLVAAGLTEGELRSIARSDAAPAPKRAAAVRVLRMVEYPDLADMQALVAGAETLEQARARGVNTSAIRKLKERRQVLYEDKEAVGEVVTREIELHDRSGDDFDRVCDRTEGRPTQTTHLTAGDGSAGEEPVLLVKFARPPAAPAGG